MTVVREGIDLAIPHAEELFIGGSWQPPATGARFAVVNPSNESVLAELPDVAPADVDKAVAAARAAFDDGPWPDLPIAERIARLRVFSDALLAGAAEIGLAWGAECGPTAPYRDAINGIVAPTLYDDAYAMAASIPFSDERTGFAGPVTVAREPYGVAVTILTYNGPLAYIGMKVLPALLSGNTVILKLPLETRLVTQYVAAAAERAGLPPGVLSVLAAGAEASRYLVEHPGIDMVSFTGGTTVGGPVAVSRTRDRCESFVASALREGATLACGGKRPAGLDRGWYFEPTLLTDVKNTMAVAQEEVFGPVFTVLTYDDIDDAVRIANDSSYGLTGAIFTHDANLARRVGRRLRVGSFTMNSTGGVLGQPFGGYKRSGIGREMGLEGFGEWTQTTVLKVNDTGNYLS
jgi:acyl-CoA reductase-like NAD-dependent aldehyde dehydrogenase